MGHKRRARDARLGGWISRRQAIPRPKPLLGVSTFGTQAAAFATPLESLGKSASEHEPHDLDRLISIRFVRGVGPSNAACAATRQHLWDFEVLNCDVSRIIEEFGNRRPWDQDARTS
jgi:hypothetical protein